MNYSSMKNHSMMEDYRRDPKMEALRANNVELLNYIRVPVGHILSVIVEEMKEHNPDVNEIAEKWNKHVENMYSTIYRFKDFSDILTDGDALYYGLNKYLMFEKNIGYESSKRVINAALGYSYFDLDLKRREEGIE